MPITPKTGSLFHAETQGYRDIERGACPVEHYRAEVVAYGEHGHRAVARIATGAMDDSSPFGRLT
jgi:hypothetical protein